MGCGGSRAVNDYVEANKEGYGKQSDLELAVQHIEAHQKLSVNTIKKVQYSEKASGTKVVDAQHWMITAVFSDEKSTEKSFNVWIAADGTHEVSEANSQ